MAYDLAFKNFFGLFQFFGGLWCLRSLIMIIHPKSVRNFMYKHLTMRISILAFCVCGGGMCMVARNPIKTFLNSNTMHNIALPWAASMLEDMSDRSSTQKHYWIQAFLFPQSYRKSGDQPNTWIILALRWILKFLFPG